MSVDDVVPRTPTSNMSEGLAFACVPSRRGLREGKEEKKASHYAHQS